jgi:hypothetical protein
LTGGTRTTDLLGPQGIGPLWGMASSDLNATLLACVPECRTRADLLDEHQQLTLANAE